MIRIHFYIHFVGWNVAVKSLTLKFFTLFLSLSLALSVLRRFLRKLWPYRETVDLLHVGRGGGAQMYTRSKTPCSIDALRSTWVRFPCVPQTSPKGSLKSGLCGKKWVFKENCKTTYQHFLLRKRILVCAHVRYLHAQRTIWLRTAFTANQFTKRCLHAWLVHGYRSLFHIICSVHGAYTWL